MGFDAKEKMEAQEGGHHYDVAQNAHKVTDFVNE
jgi:hypothetical protein